MKKITVLSMGMCAVLALASCGKSKESAYKKAYEKDGELCFNRI